MNRRSPVIDFGPISLPMAGDAGHGEASGYELRADVAGESAKLKRLLAGAAPVPRECAAGVEPEVSILGNQAADAWSGQKHPNVFTRVAKLIFAGEAAVSAVCGCGTGNVRITLKADLLPDASLSIEDGGQRWIFCLHVGDEQTVDRLARDLDLLALEVGPRIDRPIEIQLIAADRPSTPVRTVQFDFRCRP